VVIEFLQTLNYDFDLFASLIRQRRPPPKTVSKTYRRRFFLDFVLFPLCLFDRIGFEDGEP
jgi:hypothetical protein